MTLDFTKPYCLVHKDGRAFYASGPVTRCWQLADLPRPTSAHPVISIVPYAQIRERGYVAHGGDEPIIALVPEVYEEITLADVIDFDRAVALAGEPTFEPSDEVFAEVLQRVVDEEIRRGEGSNFLISRRADATIAGFDAGVANVIFGRLTRNEIGAYLSFCLYDGERFFIGSSPERHLTYERGQVLMTPICGTLPRRDLHTRDDLIAFLSDEKEINELFQVVDEELKMMSRICGAGGVVRGPYLREMSALVHTEYVLDGSATMDPIEAFRESMYAATMVGSPLENAARVIHRHEYESRRYYTGALVLMGIGPEGDEYLDSAITIRTMEVTPDGHAVIRSGASIVRDSVPAKECAEVRAKAAGLLRAITSAQRATPYLDDFVDAEVTEVLNARNEHLSRFWIDRQSGQVAAHPHLVGRSVLLIDNEDQFTEMLKHVLEHQGLKTTICDYRDEEIDYAGHDLVLVGPGPGDPNDLDHAKMARLHVIVADLLARRQPFLAVCLGHQILCRTLGMTVEPVDPPLQGVQKRIDLFGRPERVGFYNTFFARVPDVAPEGVEVSAEPDGRVIALRAPHFYSFQFHVESVLTTNCVPILQAALTWLLSGG